VDYEDLVRRFMRLGAPDRATAERQADQVFASFDRQVESGVAPEAAGRRVREEFNLVEPTRTQRFVRGMKDTGQGLVQTGLNITNPEKAAEYTEEVNRQRVPYDDRRFDPWRIAGQVVASSPLMVIPGGQARVAARLGASALAGGLAGGAEFNPSNRAMDKVGQVAFGAAGGAVGDMAMREAARVAGAVGARVSRGAARAPDPQQLTQQIRAEAAKQGIPDTALTPARMQRITAAANEQVKTTGNLDVPPLLRKLEIEDALPGAQPTTGQVVRDPGQWRAEMNAAQHVEDMGLRRAGQEAVLSEEGVLNAVPNLAARVQRGRLRTQQEAGVTVGRTVGNQRASDGMFGGARKIVDDAYESAKNLPGADEPVAEASALLGGIRQRMVETFGEPAWQDLKIQRVFAPFLRRERAAASAASVQSEAAEAFAKAKARFPGINEDLVKEAIEEKFGQGVLNPPTVPQITLREALDARTAISGMRLSASTPGQKKLLGRAIDDLDDLLESTGMVGQAAEGFSAARALRKAQADLFQENAQRSALLRDIVGGKTKPANIMRRALLSEDPADLAHLKKTLLNPVLPGAEDTPLLDPAAGREAWEQIREAAVDYVQRRSVAGAGSERIFSPHRYRQALSSIGDRLGVIFDPEEIYGLERLARASKYLKDAPPTGGVPPYQTSGNVGAFSRMMNTPGSLASKALSTVSTLPLVGKEAALGRAAARLFRTATVESPLERAERISRHALTGAPHLPGAGTTATAARRQQIRQGLLDRTDGARRLGRVGAGLLASPDERGKYRPLR